MPAAIQKKEGNKVEIKIQVNPQTVNSAILKVYQHLKQSLKIDGFRQGKAPRSVVEQALGKEKFYEEARDHALEVGYIEAVKECSLDPIDNPNILDVGPFEENAPFEFTAEVEVWPDISLPDFSGIRAARQKRKDVSEEDVEKALLSLREKQAALNPVERAAQKGDVVVLSALEAIVDGQPWEDLHGKDVVLEIGKPQEDWPKRLSDEVEGKQKGIQVEVGERTSMFLITPERPAAPPKIILPGQEQETKPLPALWGPGTAPEVSAATATHAPQEPSRKQDPRRYIKAEIKEVREKILPEVNGEFLNKIGNFKTLQDLKDEIKKKLEEEMQRRIQDDVVSQVLRKVVEASDFKIPETLLRKQVKGRLTGIAGRLKEKGIPLETYFDEKGLKDKQLMEQMVRESVAEVSLDLIIGTVVRKESLNVSVQELEQKIGELAKTVGKTPGELRKILESTGGIHELEDQLLREKTVDFIVSKAQVGDET